MLKKLFDFDYENAIKNGNVVRSNHIDDCLRWICGPDCVYIEGEVPSPFFVPQLLDNYVELEDWEIPCFERESRRLYITKGDIRGAACKIYESTSSVILYYIVHKSMLIVTDKNTGNIYGTTTVYGDNLVYNVHSEVLFFKESGAKIWDLYGELLKKLTKEMTRSEIKTLLRLSRDSQYW